MSSIFDLEQKDEVYIVNLHLPQIDMFNVTELLEDFKDLVEKKPANVVLNLKETSFVDSSGMIRWTTRSRRSKSRRSNSTVASAMS